MDDDRGRGKDQHQTRAIDPGKRKIIVQPTAVDSASLGPFLPPEPVGLFRALFLLRQTKLRVLTDELKVLLLAVIVGPGNYSTYSWTVTVSHLCCVGGWRNQRARLSRDKL